MHVNSSLARSVEKRSQTILGAACVGVEDQESGQGPSSLRTTG
jgi:hypothetical protein